MKGSQVKQGALISEQHDWNCLGIVLRDIPSLRDDATGELSTSTDVAHCLSAFSLAVASMQRDLREQAQEIKRLQLSAARQ